MLGTFFATTHEIELEPYWETTLGTILECVENMSGILQVVKRLELFALTCACKFLNLCRTLRPNIA
jgi:hypothetical protein